MTEVDDVKDVDDVRLPDPLLERLSTEFCDPRTVALGLVGSHSRGMATPDSDIDLTRVVDGLPADAEERLVVRMRDGWLVSVLTTTLDDLARALKRPERAVWTVPALRDARLLYDPTSRLAQLQEDAAAFHWEPLQAAADTYASQRLLKFAEEAYSLGGALRRDDAEQAMTETMWLVLGLPLVVAVQKGIFLLNETRAPVQVQQVVGHASRWARAYRVAAGLEPDEEGQLAVHTRGAAGLQLYATTVELLRPVLQPAHAEVVDTILARVRCIGP
jgi:hypothetical protein